FGLYDLVRQSQFTEDAPPLANGIKVSNYADQFAGVNCREASGIATLASPISYITKDCPPVLIQAGTDDEVVSYEGAIDFVNRVNAVCGEGRAVLESIPGALHGDPAYEAEQYESSRFEFLDRVLK
ncbi:MAG: hypothetical protein Q4B55_07215, partial [Lachnospiraceae bacterium]|nr:hypothetical protein [Lachnospiraceae bacterium]